MRLPLLIGAVLLIAIVRLRESHERVRTRGRDRGDVPGWVMVTMMTAILVVAIIGIFEPQIKRIMGDVLDSVTGSGK